MLLFNEALRHIFSSSLSEEFEDETSLSSHAT